MMSKPNLITLVCASSAILSIANSHAGVTITSGTGIFQEPPFPRDFPASPAATAFLDSSLSLAPAGPSFYWGSVGGVIDPFAPSPTSSSIDFVDAALGSGLSSGGPAISLGTFTYYNGLSDAGTGVPYVDFKLTLDVYDGLATTPQDFVFPLEIKNIFNSIVTGTGDEDPSAPENADMVRFLVRSLPIGNGEFLNLAFVPATGSDGFGAELQPEGFNAFKVLEDKQWSAEIYAKIGGQLQDVQPTSTPDTGSTFAILGSAFFLLSFCSRRKVGSNEPAF